MKLAQGKLTQVQRNKVEHVFLQCSNIIEKWRSILDKKFRKKLTKSMLGGKTDFEFPISINQEDFVKDVKTLNDLRSNRHSCLYNATAEEAFLIGYNPLIIQFVAKFKKSSNVYAEIEDLFQEALSDLLYSIYLYDSRKSRMTTYVRKCLTNLSQKWMLEYNNVYRFSTKIAVQLQAIRKAKMLHPEKSDEEIYNYLGFTQQEVKSLKSMNGSVLSLEEAIVTEPVYEIATQIDEVAFLSDLFNRAELNDEERDLIMNQLYEERGWMKKTAEKQGCTKANISRKYCIAKNKIASIIS